jgi:hypothetical protein
VPVPGGEVAHGVVLHSLTASQLQGMMSIYKTSQVNASGVATGTVWYLPQSLAQNTLAAFQLGSATLEPSAPYCGPCNTPGQECSRIFLYGPCQVGREPGENRADQRAAQL